MSSDSSFSFWAVVPAAGRGSRMAAAGIPKQYLQVAGKTVLEWSLSALLRRADCKGVFVALSADDEYWNQLGVRHDARVRTTIGGKQRSDSVSAGLEAVRDQCSDSDWILVHDAARPCLSADDLDLLIATLRSDEVGGLLAAPVVDTLKRTDSEGRIAQTLNREGLWRALTPQMFRFGVLRRALKHASEQQIIVTDEAQAVELLGLKPRLVPGNADNIKVTLTEDLARAEKILMNHAAACSLTGAHRS